MFARSAALPAPVPPLSMRANYDVYHVGARKAPVDRSIVSPYLRRPLRRLEEVEKTRDKNAGKQPEKDADVTERR
jgi:hypothetical protein